MTGGLVRTIASVVTTVDAASDAAVASGVGLLPLLVRRPVGGLPGKLDGALSWARGLAVGDVLSLADPRPGRRHRRVRVGGAPSAGTAVLVVEVRGLDRPGAPRLIAALQSGLSPAAGVAWWRPNAVTGRVSIGVDARRCDPSAVVAIVAAAEQDADTTGCSWSRQVDLPGDSEPVLAACLAVGVQLTGLAVLGATGVLPRPGLARVGNAVAASLDHQPRVRRVLESHLGAPRTDLVLTVGKTTGQVVSGDLGGLLADTGQRLATVRESLAGARSMRRWEELLHRPGTAGITERPEPVDRPCPLPPGPVERLADRTAGVSLTGAAFTALTGRGAGGAAEVLLAGVPKAARAARESFAGTLSASLSGQGVLTLDPGAWRRLDRVTAVVVDSAALRGQLPLVIDARVVAPGWTDQHVWGAGQRLVSSAGSAEGAGTMAAGLPIPPPGGRERVRLRLRAPQSSTDPAVDSGAPAVDSGARWLDLIEDDQAVGQVLVGRQAHPGADAVLATARRAGLRVVLAGPPDPCGGELRSRADEVAQEASITAAVHRLQAAGHVVALLSAQAHRGLAAADIGIGLCPACPGDVALPWTADVVCPDLAAVQQILAATATARRVSERGRTLAISGSALAALLVVAAPRRSAWRRVLGPVNVAAFGGLLTGVRAARRAGRAPAPFGVGSLPWHALEVDEVLLRLPDPAAGGAPGGPGGTNPAPPAGPVGRVLPAPLQNVALRATAWLRPLREELADPLTPVLSVGAAASAILGAPTDAVLVASVMGVNALVSAAQRRRAEAAMRALRSQQKVLARRLVVPVGTGVDLWPDGEEETLPADRLRVGELIVLHAGDVVPADARLLRVAGLEVDESGLTGESITVDKQVAATPGAPLAERACMVFEGSVVVAGEGLAVVVAVGEATHAGRALAGVRGGVGAGGVQGQLRRLTDKALPLTLAGGALVTGLGLLRARPIRAALSDGVAVAVAAVPEGLPLVATVAQLAAARRLSHRGVLVRSSRTVEALGRVDTVCFDKTGTLTEGTLALIELADLERSWVLDGRDAPDAGELLRAAARACPDPRDGAVPHATDRAVLAAAGRHRSDPAEAAWERLAELPFQSNRGYAATLGRDGGRLRLIVKGAPEILLARCVSTLTATERGQALAMVQEMAERGLRVLVLAGKELDAVPDDLEPAVDDLTLLGFLGLADTPRPSAVPTLGELRAHGIGVRMITGDHPVTARAVAAQLGIATHPVVTGPQLDLLDESAQDRLIAEAAVFARVTPEHKVRIVAALKRAGHVVAMTGDGSNDAAAIRLADVGIGIAGHGSAAARDAADLILTQPDLTLLLDSLVEGRLMWQRVRDAVAILLGGNAGEVAFTLFGTALTGRAPVNARQFLLVNLLTDMFPAMAVALADPPADTGIPAGACAQSRARDLGTQLDGLPAPDLGASLTRSIAMRGAATAAGASAAWLIGRGTGTRRRAATMGLTALVGTQLGQTLLLGGRSPLVWATATVSGAVLVGIVQTPLLSQFFGCTPLDPAAWAVVATGAAGATVGSVVAPRVLRVVGPRSGRVVERLRDRLQIPVVRMQ
jgi:cation-transporting ATPase I